MCWLEDEVCALGRHRTSAFLDQRRLAKVDRLERDGTRWFVVGELDDFPRLLLLLVR